MRIIVIFFDLCFRSFWTFLSPNHTLTPKPKICEPNKIVIPECVQVEEEVVEEKKDEIVTITVCDKNCQSTGRGGVTSSR